MRVFHFCHAKYAGINDRRNGEKMYNFGKKKNNKLVAIIVILIVAAMLLTTVLAAFM